MPAFTDNQWAVLALVFILGWLLGLLSRSGGGKWRRAYHAERNENAARREQDEARIRAANERIAELESRTPAPIGAGVGAAAAGRRDDLSQIRGVGRDGETRLNELGIHSYRDITGLSAADEAALEGRMGSEPGTIARERWREQAELLATGRTTISPS